jgi:yecA family protein
MNTPTYQDIKNALARANNLITPSELHGILCGLICAGTKKLDTTSLETSLLLHLPENENDTDSNIILNDLFNSTQEKIQQFELDFELLLPDQEEASLSERAQEFGKWCDGFLAGIGLAGIPLRYRDENEVADILYKLGEVAKIHYHNLSFTEEDEAAFFDVTEFVRLSVFAIHQELITHGTGGTGDRESDHKYH